MNTDLARIEELLNDDQLVEGAQNEYGVSFFMKRDNDIGAGLVDNDDGLIF